MDEVATETRSDKARRAGSIKSDRKREQASKNLVEARERKRRLFELGVEADTLIRELGKASYKEAVKIGVAAVRSRISAHTPNSEA